MVLMWILIGFFAGYALLVLWCFYAWIRIPVYQTDSRQTGIPISIIIPARNEEENISQLLEAISNQSYPAELIEVIVVDDQSTDQTAAVVSRFPWVKLLRLSPDVQQSHKKRAIEYGISMASYEWILTTDADCIPPVNWVAQITSFAVEKDPVLIVAPVRMEDHDTVSSFFQTMDFMVLQTITGAMVHRRIMSMCNGANLAYRRSVFNEVGGFSGIDHIASGDDMLLMHKIRKKYPNRIEYLKSTTAIVDTLPQPGWRSFFRQRIRWASKAGNYEDKSIMPVLLLVYLFNAAFPTLLIGGFYDPVYWHWLGYAWLGKTMVEWPLFIAGAVFFDRRYTISFFPLFQPLHIAYTLISGLLGQIGHYEWKGRRVR